MPASKNKRREGPLIVGLVGFKGVGKSAVAKHLCAEHGFTRRPFAFHLKAMAGALGIPTDILDGDDAMKSRPLDILGGKTTRYALQTLGTEWGRNFMGQDFWTNRWRSGLPACPRVVADDVRFPNEAEVILSLGGLIVRIEREGCAGDGHASENPDAIHADVSISNNGSMEQLRKSVDELVKSIGLRAAINEGK